jgi:hypothetical protein
MRTLIFSIATAASALAITAPASAQYYPQHQGYGQGYGQNYHHPGFARALDARIDALQRQIKRMDARNVISEREADRLKAESRRLEARLARLARNGFSGGEANSIERGIARLEQRMARFANNGRYGNQWGHNQWGNNGGWIDRDRDGRDDRYEDDRGTRHD